jgi:hypothetical protein
MIESFYSKSFEFYRYLRGARYRCFNYIQIVRRGNRHKGAKLNQAPQQRKVEQQNQPSHHPSGPA